MLDVFIRGLLLATFLLFRQLFIVFRTVIYMITGTYWEANRNWTLPGCYQQSAHVELILCRYRFDTLTSSSLYMDFITIHDHFERPDYVLKDNVTLYCIEKDMALFVEAPDGVEVWRSKFGCFMKPTQFQYARKVITMPLRSFHKLAETFNDPRGRLIFLQNTARCGSTLLTRMFEETGQCMVLSEPDVLNVMASYVNSPSWENSTLQKVTQNAVRLLCKCRNYQAYFIKLSALGIGGAPVLKAAFPDSVHLFMYRNCLETSKSLLKSWQCEPLVRLAVFVNSISPSLTQKAVQAMGFTDTEFTFRVVDAMHGAVSVWWISVKQYIQLREEGFDIVGIRYEDLVEDPENAFRAIIRYCTLPEDWIHPGIAAMKTDSQINSILSKANLDSLNIDLTLKPDTKEHCNRELERLKLPLLGQPACFPGTITYKEPKKSL